MLAGLSYNIAQTFTEGLQKGLTKWVFKHWKLEEIVAPGQGYKIQALSLSPNSFALRRG